MILVSGPGSAKPTQRPLVALLPRRWPGNRRYASIALGSSTPPGTPLEKARVGFFDTDILGKDHKAEAAVQPASLRIAVPVRYKSEHIPAGDGIQHRQNVGVEFDLGKRCFK